MDQTISNVPAILPALPEIVLALGAMALLMFGVFRKGCTAYETSIGAVALLIVVSALLLMEPNEPVLAFGGSFVVDGFTKFTNLLVLLAAAVAIIMSLTFIRREAMNRFEYPVLIVLATLG